MSDHFKFKTQVEGMSSNLIIYYERNVPALEGTHLAGSGSQPPLNS